QLLEEQRGRLEQLTREAEEKLRSNQEAAALETAGKARALVQDYPELASFRETVERVYATASARVRYTGFLREAADAEYYLLGIYPSFTNPPDANELAKVLRRSLPGFDLRHSLEAAGRALGRLALPEREEEFNQVL